MIVSPTVTLIARTQFDSAAASMVTGGVWTNDQEATSGENLAEMSGRACFQSWNRPNPKTAKNADYIRHIIEVGHWSVLEHASFTVYIEGVSRSLTHELVRHRHFSYSQQSQRYVDESDADWVCPPAYIGDKEIEYALDYMWTRAVIAYNELVKWGVEEKNLPRKQAREAARAILPNMIETRITVTGNWRAWAHFFEMRRSDGADAEIHRLADKIYEIGQRVAPSVFP